MGIEAATLGLYLDLCICAFVFARLYLHVSICAFVFARLFLRVYICTFILTHCIYAFTSVDLYYAFVFPLSFYSYDVVMFVLPYTFMQNSLQQ